MFRRANETYREHRVAAAPGTQAKLVELVRQHARTDAQMLDLGAFTGAQLARLRDSGLARMAGPELANHLSKSVASFRACGLAISR